MYTLNGCTLIGTAGGTQVGVLERSTMEMCGCWLPFLATQVEANDCLVIGVQVGISGTKLGASLVARGELAVLEDPLS